MSSAPQFAFDRRQFIDHFEALGKHPVEAGGLVWFESGPCFFQSFPFHAIQRAADVPLHELFKHPRVLAARYAQAPHDDEEAPAARSALWIRRTPYSLGELSSNYRNQVRRGLKNTRVERVDFDALVDKGLPLIESTAIRQRVGFSARQRSAWQRTCRVSQHSPQMEAWGGFVGDALAVFAVCFQVEDCYQISTVRSDSALLSAYPNYALVHTLLEDAFSRPGVASVCYGLASLDRGTDGLHHFKRKAGFDAEPVDDVIVGRLPILAVRASGTVLDRLASRSHRLAQFSTISKSASWWRQPH